MSEENSEIVDSFSCSAKNSTVSEKQHSKSLEVQEKAALLAAIEELTKQNEKLRADNVICESRRCEVVTKGSAAMVKLLEDLVTAKSEQLADKKEQLDSVRAELNKLRPVSEEEQKLFQAQKLQRDVDAAKLKDLEDKIADLEKLRSISEQNEAENAGKERNSLKEVEDLSARLEGSLKENMRLADELQKLKNGSEELSATSKEHFISVSQSTLRFDGKVGTKREFVVKNITKYRIAFRIFTETNSCGILLRALPYRGFLDVGEEKKISVTCPGVFDCSQALSVNALIAPEDYNSFNWSLLENGKPNLKSKLIAYEKEA